MELKLYKEKGGAFSNMFTQHLSIRALYLLCVVE